MQKEEVEKRKKVVNESNGKAKWSKGQWNKARIGIGEGCEKRRRSVEVYTAGARTETAGGPTMAATKLEKKEEEETANERRDSIAAAQGYRRSKIAEAGEEKREGGDRGWSQEAKETEQRRISVVQRLEAD